MNPRQSSLANASVTNITRLKLRGSRDYSENKRSPSKEASESRHLMSSAFETYQAEFRRNGWNLAGANLLSLSCWIARQNFIYVRPRLSLRDFILALVFAIMIGSVVGGLAWAFNPVRDAITTTWYAGTVGFLHRFVIRWWISFTEGQPLAADGGDHPAAAQPITAARTCHILTKRLRGS